MDRQIPVIIPIIVLIIFFSFLGFFIYKRTNHPVLIDYDIKTIKFVEPFNNNTYELDKKDVEELKTYLKMIYKIDKYNESSLCDASYGGSIIINGEHTLFYECNAKYDNDKVYVPEKAYNALERVRDKY